jgi:hypothetical protein
MKRQNQTDFGASSPICQILNRHRASEGLFRSFDDQGMSRPDAGAWTAARAALGM